MKLKDKVAFVTGSGGQTGYGRNIAMTLAQEGCDIVVADIDLEGAKKTAAEVEILRTKGPCPSRSMSETGRRSTPW